MKNIMLFLMALLMSSHVMAQESQDKTANVYLSNDCGFLISNLHNICTTCIAHVC